MTPLTRQRSVFERTGEADPIKDFVLFECDGRLLTMARHDWVDMGSPERATVAIEPGDLLNERRS